MALHPHNPSQRKRIRKAKKKVSKQKALKKRRKS